MMEKIILQTIFLLLIFWKLYVNWVPKLIQKSFRTREKQFVQRWETKGGANAGKVLTSFLVHTSWFEIM